MHWTLISFLMAMLGTIILVTAKFLKGLPSIQVASTNFFSAGMIALLFLSRHLRFKADMYQVTIVIRAICGLSMVFLVQSAAKQKMNIGLVTSLSYAIMVPIVTFLTYFLYNERLSKIKLAGMGFALFGVYLMLKLSKRMGAL